MGGRAGGGGGAGIGGRGGASRTAQYNRMQKMQAAGYSADAARTFATNTAAKIVVDAGTGKVYRKGKGVVESGVTQSNVMGVVNKYAGRYKGSQAVKVFF